MPARSSYDAVVVGSGPNGLAAAIEVARTGRAVLVLEAKETIGGGTRTAALTLPGFLHDVCSAVHPLALASPFFRTLPLESLGAEAIRPPLAVAHPLDNGTAAVLDRSIKATGESLGGDAGAYARLMGPLLAQADALTVQLLAPLRLPRHPLAMARFGLLGLRSAAGLARARFRDEPARALFCGLAAHSILPLEQSPSAAFGLVLGLLGHAVGWPVIRGGSERIAGALAAHLRGLGGEIVTGHPVQGMGDVPPAAAVLFDVTPRQLLGIAGDRLPAHYRRRLEGYRYGPGVFKVDWALEAPIPWRARECARAGTLHLGGTMDEMIASEAAVWRGAASDNPYVLLAQPSLFDPSRAPKGRHTAWAYCHVPNGSTRDMTEAIERQVERFAPGFRDRILARRTMTAAALEGYNANYVGGDINGGVQDLRQLFTRPVARVVPYSTPARGIYLCSSSTPPGGGVHGMCGYYAARAALRYLKKR